MTDAELLKSLTATHWHDGRDDPPHSYKIVVTSLDNQLGYGCEVSKALARQQSPFAPIYRAQELAKEMALRAWIAEYGRESVERSAVPYRPSIDWPPEFRKSTQRRQS